MEQAITLSIEDLYNKLVVIARGDTLLVGRALTLADPESNIPRLEKIVDYILQEVNNVRSKTSKQV